MCKVHIHIKWKESTNLLYYVLNFVKYDEAKQDVNHVPKTKLVETRVIVNRNETSSLIMIILYTIVVIGILF